MKLTLGEEHVIVQGIRPEEQLWGPYQFPRPYNLGDRLVVGVFVDLDDMKSYGTENLYFESRDNGVTWQQVDPSVKAECGLKLQNGDKIYFPIESGTPLKDYILPQQVYRTPGTDMTKRAEEGHLPFPDGMTSQGGITILAYNADRMPESLGKKEWRMLRLRPGETEPETEYVPVDWPYLTRVVFTGPGYPNVLKSIFPRGDPKIGPDGAIWLSAFSGEGHLNPENGQYSPYYSAELFRSDDMGHSFKLRGHMEYPADGHKYPYLSGGFSDSDFAFMPDGSMIWAFRSNWYGSTGLEWSPMYISRSVDMGYTWSKPEKFTDIGTLPRFCRLKCGTTLLCYARPGMFMRYSLDENCKEWSEPVELMTPGDRSSLHNIKVDPPTFIEWVGACNNPEMVPIDDNSVMFFYSDFYYPDKEGVKRKTILCRKITVEP